MLRCAAQGALLLATACATAPDPIPIEQDVQARTGHAMEVEPSREPTQPAAAPPGVRLDDGLTEDEAAAIAIWNSPQLRIELTRLASAHGDLVSARRPSNPTLRFLFPSGPQQLALLLTWPLENLVLMRRRIAVAQADLDTVASSIVQAAVDLVRQTRLAHVDWQLALDRLQVRQAVAEQAGAIAEIARARGAAGDAPLREGDTATTDARVAADEATRAQADVTIARARLVAVMGWPQIDPLRRPELEEPSADAAYSGAELEAIALQSRPDLRATQLAIEAAGARLGLQRSVVLRFAGVGSSAGRSVTGGVQAELPIFDQNQAGIARARAQLDAAKWRYQDLRAQIVADVTQARLQRSRAIESLARYRASIVQERQRDVDVVTQTYELGEIDYSDVLIAQMRLEGARLREVELVAEARRGRAELERALGRRLGSLPVAETP